MIDRIQPISKSILESIAKNYPVTTGNTSIYPGCYPNEIESFGFKQRDARFNDLKGLTATRINNGRDRIILGVSYFDKKNRGDDEDYFVIDVENMELESFIGIPGQFRKRYPNHGQHHEDKSYLNNVD